MDISREAKIHCLLQITKLKNAIEALEKMNTTSGNELFARKLGETILACDIFVDNTKHQHRTLCAVIKGKRA